MQLKRSTKNLTKNGKKNNEVALIPGILAMAEQRPLYVIKVHV
jgi:hypothetical protein